MVTRGYNGYVDAHHRFKKILKLTGLTGGMGQVCTATSRLYVQDTIYDKFLNLFKKHTKENTNIGSQFDANVTHGPQISKTAQDRSVSQSGPLKDQYCTQQYLLSRFPGVS